MQRCADLVRSGHHRYISGEISVGKAAYLEDKFRRLYDANLNRLEASRHRSRGRATSRLLMFAEEMRPGKLIWILLVTDGLLPIETNENWLDPMNARQRIAFWGYELVRLPKPEEPKPTWTWRYEKNRLQELRNRIRHLIRVKQDHELDAMINSLWRSPGFAGVRVQIKLIGQLIQDEWKRSRRQPELMPSIPRRIGYVQRLKDKGLKLSVLLKQPALK